MKEVTTADATLVQQTLSGDLESFGILHQRYFERVVRVLLRVLRDRDRAEDTAQSAYASALASLPRLTRPQGFYPWLCRIAVNQAIEDSRKRSGRARLRDQWLPPTDQEAAEAAPNGESALQRLIEGERAARVRQAIDQLPERQRAALVMRFFDDMSMRTIGEVLGCNEATVRSHVFRGLRRLGTLLEERSGLEERSELEERSGLQ